MFSLVMRFAGFFWHIKSFNYFKLKVISKNRKNIIKKNLMEKEPN